MIGVRKIVCVRECVRVCACKGAGTCTRPTSSYHRRLSGVEQTPSAPQPKQSHTQTQTQLNKQTNNHGHTDSKKTKKNKKQQNKTK